MTTFVIYETGTGVVRGVYRSAHDDPAMMANNTPAGCSAMTVDPESPVCLGQTGWAVVEGVLQLVPPTPAELLSAAMTAQSNAIEAAYQNATFSTAIAYMSTTFWADQNSQNMLMGALLVFNSLGGVPSGFQWWDATNTGVAMTLAQLQGLAQAILARVNTNFARRKALLAEIAAAASVAAVQAIVW